MAKKKGKKKDSLLEWAELILDLWDFIENVTPEDPERQDKFFALRVRVRQFAWGETTGGN